MVRRDRAACLACAWAAALLLGAGAVLLARAGRLAAAWAMLYPLVVVLYGAVAGPPRQPGDGEGGPGR